MISTTWANLRNALGLGKVNSRRRIAKIRGNWGDETERMESRALLSASGGLHAVTAAPAEMSVVARKATLTYPNVDGNWDVTGGADGTAHLTQTKNKVVANISTMGIDVTMKGHFSKAHSHELSGTAHVVNPTGMGPKRLAVKVQIDFGSGSEGTTAATFEGDVTIKSVGLNLHVHGDKNPPPIGV